jgi:signal recognition particle receptor subunit beta
VGLSQGALGAVVLADTRRLEDCFPAVDYFKHRRIPFVVAVNCFTGARAYGAYSATAEYASTFSTRTRTRSSP